jgi:hypothetical protein
MLVAMGRLNQTVMRTSTDPLADPWRSKRYISRRLCHIGTSVTHKDFADVVLAVFSAETAASITRSLRQQTIRGQMRHD